MPRKIPNEELCEEVRRLADELGRPPQAKEMDELGAYSQETYRTRFGGWSDALSEAGVDADDCPSTELTEAQLIDAIHELAADLGHRPRVRDMVEHGRYSRPTYRDRFGSWSNALEAAGYNPEVDIETDTLIQDLRSFAARIGRQPTENDMDTSGPHSASIYRRRFGSWTDAIKAAGIQHCYPQKRRYTRGLHRVRLGLILPDVGVSDAPKVGPVANLQPRQPLPRDELLASLRDVADELGHSPRIREYDDRGEYSPATIQNRFESWDAALEAAGLVPREGASYDADALLGTLQDLAEACDRTPTVDDLRELAGHSPRTYRDHFGSWEQAIKAAGLDPNRQAPLPVSCSECGAELYRKAADVERFDNFFCDDSCMGAWEQREYTAEGNPRWQGGYENYYGPNWTEQRQRALERDGWACQSCGLDNNDHERQYETSLHVHHIRPIRTFNDVENANTLSNLVTLCQQCHKQWEGIPLRPQLAE